VAALVEVLTGDRVVVHLVNISPFAARALIVQAGGLSEHQFTNVRYAERTSAYPGAIGSEALDPLQLAERRRPIDGRHLRVELPPSTRVTLDLGLERLKHAPTYALPPW
jgi:hypothetical protein